MTSRGIIGAAAYLPHRRLDRAAIPVVAGGGGGRGTRTVASYDEDTTTMGVEAARTALRSLADPAADTLWFSTVAPAYADKTNATAVHAALRLPRSTAAFDANGSVRSAVGALLAALDGAGSHLVVSADLRSGLAGGPDEAFFGDAAAAVLVGDDNRGPVLAELVSHAHATEELLDRWRAPGEVHSKLWEERFGETRYLPLGEEAWDDALKAAGLLADQVDHVAIAGTHGRAVSKLAHEIGVGERLVGADFAMTLGNAGAAQPALLLTAALEQASPGDLIALVVLADGADVAIFRAADALGDWSPSRPLSEQAPAGTPIDYGTYLRWRGHLAVEPPRRPEPTRPSAAASTRSTDWKFGFVGSSTGAGDPGGVHLPPRPEEQVKVPMADASGTIVTFTVDRLAYSPSPPVVFAVVDFDGGGRLPLELTDVDLDQVKVGARVEPTFRRLFTADGVHNYFWKVRLI